jgi:MADS-box transcription factor
MLAAHWGSSNVSLPRTEQFIKQENRSQSIDVAAMSRLNTNGISPPQPPPQQMPSQPPPQRTQSTSSMPAIQPISRTNSLQTDPKKPRLRVQIPSEQSDAGSATADSSPKDSGTTGATPARTGTEGSHSSGVVLPPPSPSANSLMSAGATGPPNPFARPPPPSNSNSYGSRNDMETPISALPSRFVENGLLPSPSSFYPEWGFGRGDSNMLPSPLTFQTPVVQSGPSFARDDSADRERKRKTSDDGSDSGQKRVKA